MKGYWKNPEATSEAIVDGWFHTGDVGFLEDGFLTITDRKKDLIITSGGKNIAPSELERILVSDVFIDQAVVYGDGRNFVSAVLVPSFPHLELRAKQLSVEFDVQDNHIYFVTWIYQFAWVNVLLRPAHFRNMDKAFDTVDQLNEYAVVRDASHFAREFRAFEELVFHAFPWVAV